MMNTQRSDSEKINLIEPPLPPPKKVLMKLLNVIKLLITL